MAFTFVEIGRVESPYQEKFAIPRQPGLVSSALGKIRMHPEFSDPNLYRGLVDYSHLWVQFVFHASAHQGWQPLVRPPRLGGNEKKGVFATRSPFRPNPIGLSVLQLEDISFEKNQAVIVVRGLDLLNDTPVLDIKPYVPYVDQIPKACSGFAQAPPPLIPTEFHPLAEQQLKNIEHKHPEFKQLISDILAQDPRPAYHKKGHSERIYGVRLYEFNVQWMVLTAQDSSINRVLNIEAFSDNT